MKFRNYARNFGTALTAVTATLGLSWCLYLAPERLTEYGIIAREIRSNVLETGEVWETEIFDPFENIPLLNRAYLERSPSIEKYYRNPLSSQDYRNQFRVSVDKDGNMLSEIITDQNSFLDNGADGFLDGVFRGSLSKSSQEKNTGDQETYQNMLKTIHKIMKRSVE